MQKEKRKQKRKKKKRPIATFFSLLLMFCAAVLLYQTAEDFKTTIDLKKEISSTESTISSLETKQEELKNEKLKLSDDEYVKRYARGKYMMSKHGEQVFVLPPKNTEKSSDE